MRHIHTLNAPTPGAYSQGVLVDPLTHCLLFVAGQTGNDPTKQDQPVVEGGIGPQTTQILKNILAIVREAGGNADSIVSMEVYLKADDNLKVAREAYDQAYRGFFANHGMSRDQKNMPARVTLWVTEIPWENEDTQIEIRAIAAIERRRIPNLRYD